MINLGEHPNLVNMIEANKTYCRYRKFTDETTQNGQKGYVTVREEMNYLVLEKWENGSLSKYVRATGPFEELVGRFLFTQLCCAVNFMHSQEYVHLDIKLDNILLDKFFNLKLADLGIALCAKDTSKLLAHKRGTNKYMAQEVMDASTECPYNVFPADIYAVGVCLHLMLLGTYPQTEEDSEMSTDGDSNGEDNSSTKYSISSPNSALWVSDLSNDCKDLLEKLINPDPKKRPTIQEIGEHPWMTQEFPEFTGEIVYSEMSERLNVLNQMIQDYSVSLSIDMEECS